MCLVAASVGAAELVRCYVGSVPVPQPPAIWWQHVHVLLLARPAIQCAVYWLISSLH
jgi:hypothetical protein